jgi:DNA repair protein RadA/Sms
MILAVLEARCGLALAQNDVYLNVAGGLRIGEPAADLAVAAALVSSASGMPVPADLAVFGEIGLSGEIRAVTQGDARLKEAAKLGFAEALSPRRRGKGKPAAVSGLKVREIGHLQDLVALFPTDGLTAEGGRNGRKASGHESGRAASGGQDG